MRADWPLIGRDDAMSALTGVLRQGGTIVVRGEAGVGKTRLVSEVLASEPWTSVVIRGTRASAGVPLAACAGLGLDLEDDAGPTRLIGDLRARADASAGGGFVVQVDDAHLLDDASAAVVSQLAVGTPVPVIATVRDGEPMPDAVGGLVHSSDVERLEVGPLTRADVDALVAHVLDGPVEGTSSKELWQRSGGNPLYLRELVTAADTAGAWRSVDGVWTLDRFVASSRLVDLVASRLSALDDGPHAALALAVVGEPVGLRTLVELSSAADVAVLESTGLVRVDADGKRQVVHLAHPIYGDVLHQELPAAAVLTAETALADRMLRDGARRAGDHVRLASWALRTGHGDTAEVLAEGAREALAAKHVELAAMLAEAALDRGAGSEAAVVLGGARNLLGDIDGSIAALEAARDGATDDRGRARALTLLASAQFWGRGDVEQAEAVQREGMAHLTEEWARRVECSIADYRLLSGAPMVAETLARPHADTEPEASAAARVPALALMGRTAEAIGLSDAALAAREGRPDEEFLTERETHLMGRVVALTERGDLETAIELATAIYDVGVSTGSVYAQAWGALLRGRATWLVNPTDSIRWSMEAASMFGDRAFQGSRRWGLYAAALGHAWLGDALEAETLSDEAREAPFDFVGMMVADEQRADAWSRLTAGGAVADAVTALEAAAAVAEEQGAITLAITALHDVVRLEHADSVLDRLRQLGAATDSPLAAWRVRHAAACANADASELEAAVDAFESLGVTVLAAEAAAQCSHRHRSAGDTKAARRWASRAAALATACGGLHTPAIDLATDAQQLTAREREIARLAAQGLTNAQIAEQLFVSPRTVGNHLQRSFEKLGINRREDLADVLATASSR